jgi:hypothetical protein
MVKDSTRRVHQEWYGIVALYQVQTVYRTTIKQLAF